MKYNYNANREPSFFFTSSIYFIFMYLVYSLVIRILNFLNLAVGTEYEYHILKPPFTIKFILGEELIIALFFGLFLYLSYRKRYFKIPLLIIISFYLVFLSIDQMAYKHFFSHLNFSLYRENHNIKNLWSSITASMDISFFILFITAVIISALLIFSWRPRFIKKTAIAVAQYPKIVAVIILAYISITYVLSARADQAGLHRSFLVEAAITLFPSDIEDKNKDLKKIKDNKWFFQKLIYGKPQEPENFSDLKRATRAYRKKPNIVYYILESTPYWESSLNPESKYDTTPFLKKLADNGLLFKNYYTVFPGSTRGNFASLTGMFPHQNRYSNLGRYSRIKVNTLSDVLHKAGYTTALFSSSDTWFDAFDTFLTNHSWDHYLDLNMLSDEVRKKYFTLSWGVEEEVTIDMMLKWIKEQSKSSKPFFVTYISIFPHHPYDIPKSKRGFYKKKWHKRKRKYQASVFYADTVIKKFYQGLEKIGVAKDTLFIVAPDHGEAHSDLHAQNMLHAYKVYEENTNIFLIMHNRKLLGKPRVSSRVGSQVDFLATLLDVLNIKANIAPYGQSLISDKYVERPLYFVARKQYGMRDGNYKFIWSKQTNRSWLYDLNTDKKEKKNIARQFRKRMQHYKKSIINWKGSVNRLYEQLTKETGINSKQLWTEIRKKRKNFFVDRGNPLRNAFICLNKNRHTAGYTSDKPEFDGNETLAIKFIWKKRNPMAVEVAIWGPDKKRYYYHRILVKKPGRYSTMTLYTYRPLINGAYRVKINAAHKRRVIFFQINKANSEI